MMTEPSRPALRYHGGKWRIAPWIIDHFVPHDCYVEPFGGAMSVLLRKRPSFIEVYNDLFGEVVSFFRTLREQPDELIRAIELTPYSRLEFASAQHVQALIDPVERARRFYVWAWQGRGRGGVAEPGGWRYMRRASRSQTPTDDWNNIDHLWDVVARIKEVQLECDDAFKVIKRYDSPATLFYLDPPYVADTRSDRWGTGAYVYELTNDEHKHLALMLHNIKGMALLSGYSCELYDELYADWACDTRHANTDNGGTSTECLWISPAAMAALPLFAQAFEDDRRPL